MSDTNGTSMTRNEATWNKQADYMNSWQHLSEEEKLEWAMKLERDQPLTDGEIQTIHDTYYRRMGPHTA